MENKLQSAARDLRDATVSDLPAILDIEARSFAGDRFSRRQFRYLLLRAMTSFVVIPIDGQVRAYSILFTPKRQRIARLYSIAVHPDAQGLGLGGMLLRHHVALAAQLGYPRLRLEVRDDNASAIALYEKEGFQCFAQKPDYYDDGCAARCYEMRLS